MTTAQQLGLIGNSVKVQSLPIASAETFGAGNRFYTLIGQQEGYITGHTYHTIVANDVYSWEDVAGGDYNMLDNIPVINQDLTASGFTPVANTYYRHTGATNNTFTQGVIYFYDTTYHKLGESGGGTTLNKYTMSNLNSTSSSNMKLLCKIVKESKGKIMLSFVGPGNIPASCIYGDNNDINVFISGVGISTDKSRKTTIMLTINSSTGVISYGNRENYTYANNSYEVVNFSGNIRCIYFNDTEIKL